MVRNQAIGEEEELDVRSDDGFHDLADDWEQADCIEKVQKLIPATTDQSGNVC